MRVPNHRPAATKFDGENDKKQLALTQEDMSIFINLPLINTLREPRRYDFKPKTTVSSPPKFFDEDMEKWKKKFEKAIKERKEFKSLYMSNQKFTILNSNDNINNSFDPDKTLKQTSYTGG